MSIPRKPSLARFATRHVVLFNLLFVVFLLAGGLVAQRIPVDAYPDVDLDAATVMTVWLGASPEEIDTLVTSRVEDEIEGIRGIDRIVSESRPNRSNILIKFQETLSDADVDRAFQDIRAALERINDLPEDAEEPILQRQTVFEIFPLAQVAVSYEAPDLEPAARAVARRLREELLRIDGVAKIDERDIRDPEYTILVDSARAERYDVTLPEIAQLLQATNRDVPAGEIGLQGGGEIALKAAGNYRSLADVEETVIRQDPGGSHVRVRDVARVVEGYEERDIVTRFMGADAILLPISKEHDQNSLSLVDEVNAVLDKFRQNGLPEGVGIGMALDSSQIIRDRLRILLTNLGWGIALIFLVLSAGIGIRNAVLAVIGIPFCFLTALLFMDAIGVSVNAISLFAMVLISGVIVDDALIVLENIYRRLEEGLGLRDAIIEGSREVVGPVLNSTLTTMAAFLPMLMMVGVTGEFFSIIPKVVVVTLLASLFECFIVLPVHYLDFGQRLRKKNATEPDRRGVLRRALGRFGSGFGPALRRRYERTLNFVLRYKYGAIAVILAVATLAQSLAARLDTVLFPSDFQVFLINMEMSPDASLQETLDASAAVDEFLDLINSEGPFKGQIEAWTTSSGLTFTPENQLIVAPNLAQSFISLKQGTGIDPVVIQEYARDRLDQVRNDPRTPQERALAPRLRKFVKVAAEPQQDGPPLGKPVAVRVTCDDLELAEQVASRIKAVLEVQPGVTEAQHNYDEGRVEYRLHLRPGPAAAHGVTFAQAARLLATANEGQVVSIFKDPGGRDDADVRVKLDPKDRADLAAIARVRLRTASGVSVPLGDVARVEAVRAPAGIFRYNGRRTVLLTATIDEKRTSASTVNESLRRRFDNEEFLAPFPGVTLRFGGEFEETQKSFRSLRDAFMVACVVIYMLLAAQFKSYVQPLIVLLTVPFAFIGVVVGLLVTGNPFTIMAGIAMVGLIGIAVNDAIVLVDFINKRRGSGRGPRAAVDEACRLRARPILLTTVTTIAGLLPMAVGLTGFSKLWSPFASTICFGMLFGTLLTLYIVPSAYLIVEEFKAWVARRWGARTPEPVGATPAPGASRR